LRGKNTFTKDEVQHDTTKTQGDNVQTVVDLASEMKKSCLGSSFLEIELQEVSAMITWQFSKHSYRSFQFLF
jgi:hypothetical protein